ncbi:alpha/beta-hydrolase [Melanomma pulvis-pyrius CBS 109.77]|uniref:Alpha/beta-hydrolase n=1 Tax=Melanomma pulvis-pyrius CBS 109.77 TaxID=1314802 RepID=A0A6A6WYH2_9PLEO|nr:alpha/beta-hydrolase [Melanomma pulvis-pyrius CBS 109.77]
MGLLARQPVKAVYTLAALTFELARFPLWLAKYLIASGRQHTEYSFRQALGVRVFFSAVYHMAKVEVKTPLPLTPGKEKERFVVIKTAAPSFYKGPLLSADIKPVDIGATWYPAPLTTSSDLSAVTVILHLHGGAFVLGDGRTEATGYLASNLLKHTPATHVFAPQYRLSTLPASKTSNPFPAAIQDSLTAYLYLINTLKISPKNIIIGGDSAGGNASISILRYISEYGSDIDIPAPSAALLWSPWLSPAESLTGDFVRTNANYSSDYLSFPFTEWGSLAYAGSAGAGVLTNPYISPKGKPFKTPVPLFVNSGSTEVLFFDDKEWAADMKAAGNNVTFDVEPNAPHDVLLLGNVLGFDKAAASQTKRAGEWLVGVRK